MSDLGWPAPGVPNCINNSGQVVGRAGGTAACLWAGGTAIDLNTRIDPLLGWHLFDAAAINDFGQILAQGTNANGCKSDAEPRVSEFGRRNAAPSASPRGRGSSFPVAGRHQQDRFVVCGNLTARRVS